MCEAGTGIRTTTENKAEYKYLIILSQSFNPSLTSQMCLRGSGPPAWAALVWSVVYMHEVALKEQFTQKCESSHHDDIKSDEVP